MLHATEELHDICVAYNALMQGCIFRNGKFLRESARRKGGMTFATQVQTIDGSHLTLQEIGEKLGGSRERMRQIESRLKKKLKAYLEEEIGDIDLFQESMVEI